MSDQASQPGHAFAADIAQLSRHYSELLATHGDSPQAVQYRDAASHERRFEILTEVADLRSAKILDFGCGTGHLLGFLRSRHGFAGEYVGYDISEQMVATARQKFSGVRFEVRDVLADGIPEEFDYVFVNGVFNNLIGDNWGFLTAILHRLFRQTRRAVAFNALSTYVDYFDAGLYYVEPEAVFRFCKEHLSPCVNLRHDYLVKPAAPPFEFTVYAYRTEVALRAARLATDAIP